MAWAACSQTQPAGPTRRRRSRCRRSRFSPRGGHEQAVEKLDRALATGGKGDIDLQAIRAAHAALHQEDTAAARRLLEHAFPGKESHLVGVTYRPRLGGAELAAGIAAVALLLAGAAGLAHRRRLERATHRSEHAVG